MTGTADARRAVLVAALGFLQLREPVPEVTPFRKWLDSWKGLGADRHRDGTPGVRRLADEVPAGVASHVPPPRPHEPAVGRPGAQVPRAAVGSGAACGLVGARAGPGWLGGRKHGPELDQ
jgi:hypothetical protein